MRSENENAAGLVKEPGLQEQPKFCRRPAPVLHGRLMKMQLVEVRLENWRARMEDGVAYLAAVRAGGRWRYYGSDNAPRFCDADDLAIFGQALWMSDRVPDTRYDAWSRFIRMWEEGRSEK